MKILVVDDDELSRDLLALMLGREGFSITTAASGDEAVATTLQQSFDAVLTDLQMPGLSGDALALRLKAVAATPVIAMSATAVDADTIPTYDGFLLKPFSAAALSSAIAGARAQQPSPPPATASAPVLDLSIYEKLRASMPAQKLAQLYALCLDDASRRIATMQKAAAAGDDDAYRREAHALKGGCGMLGATELQTLASSGEITGIAANYVATLAEILEAVARLQRMLVAQQNQE